MSPDHQIYVYETMVYFKSCTVLSPERRRHIVPDSLPCLFWQSLHLCLQMGLRLSSNPSQSTACVISPRSLLWPKDQKFDTDGTGQSIWFIASVPKNPNFACFQTFHSVAQNPFLHQDSIIHNRKRCAPTIYFYRTAKPDLGISNISKTHFLSAPVHSSVTGHYLERHVWYHAEKNNHPHKSSFSKKEPHNIAHP